MEKKYLKSPFAEPPFRLSQFKLILGFRLVFEYFRVISLGPNWGATNGGLRDGGLRESEDIRGKRPFSSVFWIF